MGIDLNRFKSGKQDKEWLDWLQDDPVPTSIRARNRERAVRQASRPVVRRVGEQPQAVTTPKPVPRDPNKISINLQIPKASALKSRLTTRMKPKNPSTKSKRRKYALAGVATIAVIGMATTGVIIQKNRAGTAPTDATGVLSDSDQKPNFEYSLPKGDETNITGEVRYDGEKKVVNFQDSIGGVVITISQQPLPEGLKEDTEEKVKKLAEDFSAKDVLATANPTAYLGTSVKGPQTVIFAKKGLLVFIQSTKEIDDNDWAEYITNLQ